MDNKFKLSIWNYLVIGCKGIFGDGITSIIQYIAKLFTEQVLGKCNPELLKKWAEVFEALASFVQFVVGRFVTEEKKLAAANATIEAICHLATVLKDGELTADEINSEVDKILAAVEAWKAIK